MEPHLQPDQWHTKKSFLGELALKSTGVGEVVYLQVTLHMIDCKALHTHNPQDTFGGSPWHTEQHSLLVEEPKSVDYWKIQESREEHTSPWNSSHNSPTIHVTSGGSFAQHAAENDIMKPTALRMFTWPLHLLVQQLKPHSHMRFMLKHRRMQRSFFPNCSNRLWINRCKKNKN